MANTGVGPAMKGSRYCLQRYVNERPGELADQLISASPTLMAFDPLRVDWKTPLREENYREYRDDFLGVLGLQQHEAALREYWPLQGPQWDGLALLPTETVTGVLLVEAKAHPAETESTCGATHPASIATIEAAFARVQSHMGVKPGITPTDWMKNSYQFANRLAFLYFLNEVARVPAFLALVNFVDDQSYRPTSMADWPVSQQRLFRYLGLQSGCKMLDQVITIYPKAIG